MTIWAELWTRPGDAAYGRVLDDLPATSHGLHDGVNQLGEGNMTLPDTFDGFDSILFIDHLAPANCVSSTVKLFDDSAPTVPVFEWIPELILPTASKEDHLVEVSGEGIKSIVAYGRVDAYDWNGSDDYVPLVPDWVFGGDNILINGGFETETFTNGGFEDGTNDNWQLTTDNGFLTAATSIQAVNSPVDAQAGNWYGLVNPTGAKSGAVRTFSNLFVGETYTITGWMNDPTASGLRWRAGVSGASSASHVNAYTSDGYWWAEVGNAAMGAGASDGTWQSFTLTFVAAETSTQLVIIYDDPGSGPNFRIDSWNITGDGVGLYPWEARYPERTNTFERTSSPVHSGTGAAFVQGDDQAWTSPFGVSGYGRIGIQQAVTLEVGKPYQGSVWVRHSAGVNRTFKLQILRQSPLGPEDSPGSSDMAHDVQSVPTGTWTQLSVSFTADVIEALFYISWQFVGAFDTALHASPNHFFDDAVLYQGLAPTTPGEIIRVLYDQMTDTDLYGTDIFWNLESAPGTPYLTLDFSDTVDSAGSPWFDTEISIRIWMRMTLEDVLNQLANTYGYEWRVVPNNVETGTYLLQMYNAGTMKVDHTAAASPAIQGGSSDVRRSIRRRLPEGTDLFVEGLSRITGRDADLNLVGALGRIASSRIDRELPSIISVGLAAFEDRLNALSNGLSFAYSLVNPQDLPLVDYEIGDLLVIHDPPEVDFDARLVDVTGSFTPESEEWEVEFIPATAQGS